MRIHIIAVGPMKSGPERTLVDDLVSRARKTGRPLGLRDVAEHQVQSGGGKDAEAERLLSALPRGSRLVALDEHGKAWPSMAFAEQLSALRDAGTTDLCFAIGGADGHGPRLLAAAAETLAFGVQTWPHKLVRVMLAEQLYRSTTILAGMPYHKA